MKKSSLIAYRAVVYAASSLALIGCASIQLEEQTQTRTASSESQIEPHTQNHDQHTPPENASRQLNRLTPEQKAILNKTPITADRYPAPPSPHYGPEYGSLSFTDTDPGPTIGGILSIRPAVDENGQRLNEAEAGITAYMIHWGLEVGDPGVQDDKGAGDLGGDCMGFRDTGHVVMMPTKDAAGQETLTWKIPQGTTVPDGAVYFVGHTLYGQIHNLGKCTQTPIVNLIN